MYTEDDDWRNGNIERGNIVNGSPSPATRRKRGREMNSTDKRRKEVGRR
jgi:hypothetical protein